MTPLQSGFPSHALLLFTTEYIKPMFIIKAHDFHTAAVNFLSPRHITQLNIRHSTIIPYSFCFPRRACARPSTRRKPWPCPGSPDRLGLPWRPPPEAPPRPASHPPQGLPLCP